MIDDGEFVKEVRPRFEAYKQERPTIRQSGNEWLDRVLDDAFCAVFEACSRLDAQQQEIEKLNESCGFLRNEMDYLATENKAQQQEIERLKEGTCDVCGTKLVDKCIQCGAPQCCPLCCAQEKIDRLTAENAKLKQDIEHLHGQGGVLFERIAGLEKANKELTTKLNNLYELSCTEDSSKLGRDLVYSMRINEATFVQAKDPIGIIAYIFDSIKDQFYKKVQALKGEKP